MPRLDSRVDPAGEDFARNREEMLALLEEVRALERRIRANSERARAKFDKRGQMLPHDRVAALIDRGSDFLELCPFAGTAMHDDDGGENAAGGGIIAGIGRVAGRRVLVSASNSAIKGGAVSPMGMKKSLRLQQIALENKLPIVTLAESAGANLTYQSEMFVEGGRTFANEARLSAAGIPHICVVHGSSTAGGAYLPGLSDHVVVVRGRAKIFLAGPPLLKAATGEVATDEELGGADLHASIAGTAEYVAEDDADAIRIAREIVAKTGWEALDPAPPQPPRPPLHDPDQLAGAVPVDYRKPYDVRELLARILDESDFLDFKPDYGAATVCGWGAVEGWPCGFVGNNGPIDPAGSVKAAQFIQLCNQTGTPICFLQNTTGYMVGTEAERGGIVKHGSKMIQAVANSAVPHVTFLVGGSFGAGNYGMCGRSFDPRFVFAWPNARTSVMGPEQAAGVMAILMAEKAKRTGQDMPEEALAIVRGQIVERMEPETRALFGSARLWDDGIIDPRDTRRILAMCLAMAREAELRRLRPNSFGVARG
ncbi:MAG: acyl-CoA carboxylase subunit beta [Allosphingosinicella sp.]|uniref:acyl-CoA carboxylase subunit beta n=1 Tax=Allosphingosinicella sp. TaxID=2823234 RepID=UPI003938EFA7